MFVDLRKTHVAPLTVEELEAAFAEENRVMVAIDLSLALVKDDIYRTLHDMVLTPKAQEAFPNAWVPSFVVTGHNMNTLYIDVMVKNAD